MTEGDERFHAAIEQLQRLTSLFSARRRRLATACGITEQQWAVLEEIASEHFMPSMFARERESSPAAVSKTLRHLLEKQLISVSIHRDDGRQRRYELTTTGQAVMQQLRHRRTRAIDAIWRDLDRQDLDTFIRFGRTLANRLEQYQEDE